MQQTRTIQVITLEMADFIAGKAIEKATELNLGISVWIVDPSGNPVIFKRQDNSPLISIDTARKKAMTAAGFGLPTGQTWYDFIKDDPILAGGVPQMKDFILLGGGAPILLEGVMVGAIGISGGHYKQDEECLKFALSFCK
jgi:uncharacterized protein GlcG (DUF336 family)